MSEEKGRRFLELVDEQSKIQGSMAAQLARLIRSGWDLPEAKAELESLSKRHEEITGEISGIGGL